MSAESTAAVQRSVVLPVDRERAWDAITDPAELACWLADEVELEPREGGAARFRWDDGAEREGIVDECAERRRLAFRWRDPDGARESLVELTLDDVEEGTRVTVIELPTAALRAGTATLRHGTPSAWAGRLAVLTGAFAAVRA